MNVFSSSLNGKWQENGKFSPFRIFSFDWKNQRICFNLLSTPQSSTSVFSDLDSRFRLIGTGSLQISSVQDVDSGDYQCRASNSVDSLDATATLNVQLPPKFIVAPHDLQALEKDELELPCEIVGKPKPSVQWLKNGEVIKPNDYMKFTNG